MIECYLCFNAYVSLVLSKIFRSSTAAPFATCGWAIFSTLKSLFHHLLLYNVSFVHFVQYNHNRTIISCTLQKPWAMTSVMLALRSEMVQRISTILYKPDLLMNVALRNRAARSYCIRLNDARQSNRRVHILFLYIYIWEMSKNHDHFSSHANHDTIYCNVRNT